MENINLERSFVIYTFYTIKVLYMSKFDILAYSLSSIGRHRFSY